MTRNITYRDYTTASLTLMALFGLIIGFSGGVFDVYGADADSKTIQKIQNQTQDTLPNEKSYTNQSIKANAEASSFTVTDLFGLASGFINYVTAIPTIVATAVTELNLPRSLLFLASIPVFYAVWELVSVFQGIRT